MGDGLVAYYPFEGNANDASGNGNHGTEHGGPSYVGGVCGEAIAVDGANGYIEVPHADILNPEDLTIALWVSFRQQDYGASNVMVDKCIYHLDAGYYVSYSHDEGLFLAVNDDEYRHASNVHPELNVWTHFAATYERATGTTEVFVNGQSLGRQTGAPQMNTPDVPLYIGKVRHDDYGTRGKLDEVRIYDRGLSACEIRKLACAQGNNAPTADAGEDAVVYADADFMAEVTLNGSGSSDPDGDELTYLWTWTIDGETRQAEGVNPTIELPVGEHTVTLVVNDGKEDSEPNQVVITVIAPMKADLWVLPRVINRYSSMPHIMGMVRLAGISKDQVDAVEMLVLYPGGIEAISQRASECGRGGMHSTMILARFDKSALMDAAADNGSVGLTAVGRLKTGQYFCGADTIRIIAPGMLR